MNSRLMTFTMALFLCGGITWLSAATKEETDAAKYTALLKKSSNPKEKLTALKELGHLGQISSGLAKPAIPEIMTALDDKDAKVRAEAAHTIGMIDAENKAEIVIKLVKMLNDEKDETVRRGVAMGLGAMGSDAKDAVSALREARTKADKKDARTYQMALQQITGKKN